MLSPDSITLIAYVVAVGLLTSRDAAVSLLVVIICCAYANSKLYDMSTAVQVHLFYVITSLTLIPFVKSWAVITSMTMVVLLNIVMTWDAHFYGQIQTWHFTHYATNTTLIHCIIISSLFIGKRNIIHNNLLYAGIRRMLNSTTAISGDRQLPSVDTDEADKRNKAEG